MSETLAAPDPERVKVLEGARSAAYQAFDEAKAALRSAFKALETAEKELLEEQCRGLPRYAVGDVILVPKVYFGKQKMVEAWVNGVDLHYYQGTRGGVPYESRYVSYSVYLRQKDGDFGGSSEGFEHRQVTGISAGEH